MKSRVIDPGFLSRRAHLHLEDASNLHHPPHRRRLFGLVSTQGTHHDASHQPAEEAQDPHKLYPYECEAHDDFGKHAATQLGLPEAQVFKTLIAHHDKQAVVAIVPSSGLCSLKQLAKATGLKKVEMMKPAEAEKLTGYKVGGISPLAQKKLLPTVLDDSAMQFDGSW